MPTRLSTEVERLALDRLPVEVSPEDRERFFRLSETDVGFARRLADPAAQVEAGVDLGCLRMLGFVPSESSRADVGLVAFVASELGVDVVGETGVRVAVRTRRDRVAGAEAHLG